MRDKCLSIVKEQNEKQEEREAYYEKELQRNMQLVGSAGKTQVEFLRARVSALEAEISDLRKRHAVDSPLVEEGHQHKRFRKSTESVRYTPMSSRQLSGDTLTQAERMSEYECTFEY